MSLSCSIGILSQVCTAKKLMHDQMHQLFIEQVMGIEPTSQPWEGRVLPMNYTCSALTL